MSNESLSIENLVNNGTMLKNDADTIVRYLKSKKKIIIAGLSDSNKDEFIKIIDLEANKFHNTIISSNLIGVNESIELTNELVNKFINNVKESDSYVLIDNLNFISNLNEEFRLKMWELMNTINCIVSFENYMEHVGFSTWENKYADLVVMIIKDEIGYKVRIMLNDQIEAAKKLVNIHKK